MLPTSPTPLSQNEYFSFIDTNSKRKIVTSRLCSIFSCSIFLRTGQLEGDGTWDLDGYDAAAKLVILARSVLHQDINLEDVLRTRVADVDIDIIKKAHAEGKKVRLLCTATRHKV